MQLVRGNAQGSSLAGNEPLWVDGNLDQSTAFGLSGFDALPGGSRLTSGEFEFMNYNAYFWSSSESVNSAWRRTLNYYYHRVYRSTLIKEHGVSVRCLRN